jgi:NAD(P)-dependent dehydrogenase (short-subunit alcohol dehydrogenase family)
VSRRVLVTGGASGLGAALAGRFAARGDRVLVTDLVEEHDVPAGTSYLRADVTSAGDWQTVHRQVVDAWGGVDVLVNNAGIAAGGRIDVVGLDEWQRVIDVNLLGVVRGCRTFVPMLKAQAEAGEAPGHIVNTASLAGLVHPPGMASYNAVKAGVVALSETLQHELAPWGIRTSVVCPSFFRTNLASSLSGSDRLLDQIAARLIDRSGTTADEVADEVMKGVDAGRHVILTDRAGRRAWLAKRFARPLYDREQRGFAGRIRSAGQPTTTTKD